LNMRQCVSFKTMLLCVSFKTMLLSSIGFELGVVINNCELGL